MGKAKKVTEEEIETPVNDAVVIGGDGLVDAETTHGEDVKGNSTFESGAEQVSETPSGALPVMPAHEVANSDMDEQLEVAQGRKEK